MVVARFSKIRTGAFATLFLAACSYLFAGELDRPAGTPLRDYIFSNPPFMIPGLLASLLMIFLLLVMLRQLLFDYGNAIWTSEDRLFFLNFYASVTFSSLPLQDIDGVSIGSGGQLRPAGIIVQLKNGKQRFIPTYLLSEPRNIIASRLRTSIGLKSEPLDMGANPILET